MIIEGFLIIISIFIVIFLIVKRIDSKRNENFEKRSN
tara:strand:+ start:427 stop:537 length:111 start_codon:yes stop_codon:yes gene_type:complete